MNDFIASLLGVHNKSEIEQAESLEREIKTIKKELLNDAQQSAKKLDRLHEIALQEALRK